MNRAAIYCLILVTASLASCVKDKIRVTDAWARPGESGGSSAVFFVVRNRTVDNVILIDVFAEVAGMVELHRTTIVDNVMKMVTQDAIVVHADSDLPFEPRSLHVMLMGLRRDLNPGDSFVLGLRFNNGREMSMKVRVKAE